MKEMNNASLAKKLPELFNFRDRKEEKLAQVIVGLRTEQNITQETLAKKANLPKQAIFQAEGYLPGFQDDYYEKIFTALGHSFKEILATVHK